MTLTKTQRRRLVALSSIVGIMIGIGITVAAGGTLFYTFQSQTDPFTTSSSLEVRNLNAILDDDTLRVTATVKNSGQTSITSVFIDTISVTGITIIQNEDYELELTDGTDTKIFCIVSGGGCEDADRVEGFSLIRIANQTTPEVKESTLEGGRTQALVMQITSDSSPDIGDKVNISDKLNLVLKFTSGQDELLTDVFTTRVKPG